MPSNSQKCCGIKTVRRRLTWQKQKHSFMPPVQMDQPRREFSGLKRQSLLQHCHPSGPELFWIRSMKLTRNSSMAGNVLQTGLNNMGAIFHPALTILNTGWIESTHGDYQFYIDGATPSVAKVLSALDRERVTVASSWEFVPVQLWNG